MESENFENQDGVFVARPEYVNGVRYAVCTRCRMGWFEYEEPLELIGGLWTGSGERPHKCPEPFDYDTAHYLATFHSATKVPVSQETLARIRLGLGRQDEDPS